MALAYHGFLTNVADHVQPGQSLHDPGRDDHQRHSGTDIQRTDPGSHTADGFWL